MFYGTQEATNILKSMPCVIFVSLQRKQSVNANEIAVKMGTRKRITVLQSEFMERKKTANPIGWYYITHPLYYTVCTRMM